MRQKTTLKERVQSLEHSIHGNGSIGLNEQVKELKQEIKWVKRIGVAILFILVAIAGENTLTYLKHIL